jgi:hypothetical protein
MMQLSPYSYLNSQDELDSAFVKQIGLNNSPSIRNYTSHAMIRLYNYTDRKIEIVSNVLKIDDVPVHTDLDIGALKIATNIAIYRSASKNCFEIRWRVAFELEGKLNSLVIELLKPQNR